MTKNYSDCTNILHLKKNEKYCFGAVNPVLQRATSLVFKDFTTKLELESKKDEHTLYYGRRGTSTHFYLRNQLTELERGHDTFLYSCGAAAINAAVLAFLKTGDHMLMVNSAYEQAMETAFHVCPRYNIEVDFFDSVAQPIAIAQQIKANTKILYLETPNTGTMEICDIGEIIKEARKVSPDIVIIVDNTYASGVLLKPLTLGADISVASGTKYILGTSDRLLGYATANERCWSELVKFSHLSGHCADVDVVYAATNGLKSMIARLNQHNRLTLEFANKLVGHKHIKKIHHPNFPDCPGHEYFAKYFSFANGLFSIVLKENLTAEQINTICAECKLFKYAFSWGGFESLFTFLSANNLNQRINLQDKYDGTVIRFNIGFEDVEDLYNDFTQGLDKALG